MSTENHHVGRDTYNEDEISLYDLYKVLAKRKKLVGLAVAVALVIAVIYVLITPRVYLVKADLLPPASGDIYLTNIDISDDLNFKSKDIFQSYTQEVMSDERWHDFAQQHKQLFTHFSSNQKQQNPLKLGTDQHYPGTNVLVSYDTTHRDAGMLIFQQYLKFAEQALLQSLTQQIRQYVERTEKNLKLEIQDDRNIARQRRLDKIERLKNDLVIAKKLGITNNTYIHATDKSAGNKAGVFNIFANNTKTPMYLLGTKVITAELELLEKRKLDDAYIPDLRKKQGQLLRLQQVQYTPDAFHAYMLNGDIIKPRYPVKPRKKLILALGLVLGVFLGIFAAFIAEFIAKIREQAAAE